MLVSVAGVASGARRWIWNRSKSQWKWNLLSLDVCPFNCHHSNRSIKQHALNSVIDLSHYILPSHLLQSAYRSSSSGRRRARTFLLHFASLFTSSPSSHPYPHHIIMFYANIWDPLLIVSQIVLLQSLFYVCVGSWLLLFSLTFGTRLSLSFILSPAMLQIFHSAGWPASGAFLCVAPMMSDKKQKDESWIGASGARERE